MFYLTCNRAGYKLLDPHIWEVFGGKYNTESLGFTKFFSKTEKFKKSKPPIYTQLADSRGHTVILPKGSIVRKIRKPRRKLADLDKRIKELEAKLDVVQKDIPVLEERWKLSYTWCYGDEVHWNFKTKKQAVAFMEEEIIGFFGTKIVESISDIKYDKYSYGRQNESSNNTKVL